MRGTDKLTGIVHAAKYMPLVRAWLCYTSAGHASGHVDTSSSGAAGGVFVATDDRRELDALLRALNPEVNQTGHRNTCCLCSILRSMLRFCTEQAS